MLDFISFPLGKILLFIYETLAFKNYGFAIIIFTIFVRLLILPLYIKQYNSTAKMQEIQPKIQDLQKRYKNDKEKLNEELIKLYREHNVNPAGGCLPTLLQMPILFSLFYVIQSPLKYMYQIGTAARALIPDKASVKIMQEAIDKLFNMVPEASRMGYYKDLSIIHYFSQNKHLLDTTEGLLGEHHLINMDFLGLNLGLKPTLNFGAIFSDLQYLGLALIPILAAFTTWLSIKLTSVQTAKAQGDKAGQGGGMTGGMLMVMPIMIAFFSFSVPAGMGVYWITGNILQIFQQMFITRFIMKKPNQSREGVK